MRRIIAIVFGVALMLSTASVGLAVPPAPTTHQISISVATLDVSATCIGTGTPCDGTVRLTFTGSISGQLPFSEIKGVKDPQTVVGTFDFPMSMYDSETGCFTGVVGVIQLFVPQGSRTRLAFDLDSANGTGCGGAFSAAFELDSDQADVRAFRRSTGSGTLALSSNLDLEAVAVSALQVNLAGELTLVN